MSSEIGKYAKVVINCATNPSDDFTIVELTIDKGDRFSFILLPKEAAQLMAGLAQPLAQQIDKIERPFSIREKVRSKTCAAIVGVALLFGLLAGPALAAAPQPADPQLTARLQSAEQQLQDYQLLISYLRQTAQSFQQQATTWQQAATTARADVAARDKTIAEMKASSAKAAAVPKPPPVAKAMPKPVEAPAAAKDGRPLGFTPPMSPRPALKTPTGAKP